MRQLQVTVEHRTDIPGGLPAVWEIESYPSGDGARIRLYLCAGLPTEVADKFRAMCVRHSMPTHNFDSFSVTSCASEVRELRAVV